MQIETTMRYHLIPTRVATINTKTQNVANVGEDVEKLEALCTIDRNVK